MDDPSRTTADTDGTTEAVEYDPETDTYRASFDGFQPSISVAVISVVATVTDANPGEIEPLYSVLDPDALDALMTPVTSHRSDAVTRVTFTLDGHDVAVHSDGRIAVQP